MRDAARKSERWCRKLSVRGESCPLDIPAIHHVESGQVRRRASLSVVFWEQELKGQLALCARETRLLASRCANPGPLPEHPCHSVQTRASFVRVCGFEIIAWRSTFGRWKRGSLIYDFSSQDSRVSARCVNLEGQTEGSV